jgi:hypothetical protein
MTQSDSFVGIQISATCFDDTEPAALFDTIQGLVPLNTAMVFHGDRLRRGPNHHGGTPFRHLVVGLDEEGRGIMDRLQEPAEERGIRLVLGIGEDRWGYHDAYPGYTTIGMVDCHGRTHRQSCVNNPLWRRFQVAGIEDAVREHPFLFGMMFMHERSGPLSAAFFRAGYGDGRVGYCFCEHCCRLGRERGLDPARAREGYRQLDMLVESAVADDPAPADGWFISFWRLLERYHEIMGWDQLWWDCIHDYRAAVSGAARSVRRDIQIGYHFQHATLMNHFLWRAGDDPQRIVHYADWVKPSVYPGCSGTRSRGALRRVHDVLLRDMPLSVANEFLSWIMGHDPAMFPDPTAEGEVAWGADWVKQEVGRLKRACRRRPLYAGLGIGVPGGTGAETPDSVTAWAEACYAGGADGILLSRHYREMRPELLEAAGQVIRDHLG